MKKSPIELENHHVQDLVKVSWRVQISCMRVLQVYLVNKIQGEDSSFFNLTFCFKKMEATQETVILHEHILSSGQ